MNDDLLIPSFWACEREALSPPEDLDVSEWANRNIVLLPESSREPGPYRWQRTPYAKGILDIYRRPSVRHMVLKTSTQVGKTQILYDILGYIIDQDPYPTMLMYPSDAECRVISRSRVQPMIDASEALRARKPADPKRYQLTEMYFPGMVLYLSSGSSVTDMAQRPVRNLLRDEVNKYPPAIGEHGNPMDLSEERLKSFQDIRKIIDVSSPTDDEGAITLQEEKCQVILGYFVPCPHCGHLQLLEWEQVKFDDRKDIEDVKERTSIAKASARLQCPHCSGEIRDRHKEWMLSPANGAGWYDIAGKWTSPADRSSLHADPIDALFDAFAEAGIPLERVAFRLNSMYSPWITYGDVVEKFLSAHLSAFDRYDKLRSFTNDWLAREYVSVVEKKTEPAILKLKSELEPLIVPKAALALTAGIDCQKHDFYFTVWAWERNLTRWLIHYGRLFSFDQVKDLVYTNTYQREDGGHPLGIWRAGLDTGGGKGAEPADGSMTYQAYRFLAQYGGGTIFGVKGATRDTLHKMKPSIIGTFPGTQKPIPGGGIALWTVDTDYYKDIFHAALDEPAGAPGCVYLHKDTGSDFAGQISSEEKRRGKSGRAKWVHVHGQNHYLDATIYATFLTDPMCIGGLGVFPDPALQAEQGKKPGPGERPDTRERVVVPSRPARAGGGRW
ncbi:MAG TPA: phage terminase large subunit family protein [Deltaproteobacteria bacterium]|nr:phage terminase large subunit family protein [Deltaproteobacteria bacterium]